LRRERSGYNWDIIAGVIAGTVSENEVINLCAMTASGAKQELDRVRRFLRDLENGQKPENLQDEAGRMRRKVDTIIKYVKNIEE
jgi:hypothetical protein